MIECKPEAIDSPAPVPWSVAELQALVAELSANVEAPGDGSGCLGQIEVLEALKSVVCAAQVRATAAFAESESARLAEAADRARAAGRRGPAHARPSTAAVAGAQVGLARRVSPARGRALVEASTALVHDLPHTLAALARGELSEERALLVARETTHLGAADRRTLDASLDTAPGAGSGVGGLGTEALRRMVHKLALGLDCAAQTRRMRKARAHRHVTGRLLSDGTGRITAVLRAEDYAAVLKTLRQAAATARAAGDPRTSSQVRADTLTRRITGHDPATPTRIDLHLVLGLTSLLGETDDPGWIPGAGHLPAGLCRDLLTHATDADQLTVRRLFTLPDDGQLIAMEQPTRTFTGLLARLIRLRDGETCRTPWCDAPIRHLDHIHPHTRGGPTSYDNGQGLCETCNHVKETPGWTHHTTPQATDTRITITTPTGRRYQSRHTPHTG